MAFVTEIVLFRARPGLMAETTVRTVAVATEGCCLDGIIDRSAMAALLEDGRFEDAVVDGPGVDGPAVRPYHCGSRSL